MPRLHPQLYATAMWIALAIVSGLGGEPGVAPTAEANEVHLAYLDPGSGSFMVQALIAALAGIGVAGRRYWTQIKTWLGLQNRSADDEFDPDDD